MRNTTAPRWATRILGLAFAFVFVLVLGAGTRVAAEDVALDDVPEAWRNGVRRALSGSNGSALRASYEKLAEDERHGWAFLLATMRSHYVSKLTEPLLTEHVQYAYRVRRELAWTKDLPEEVFLHYVLPILSGDEPLQQWRKQFFEEVGAVLKKKRVKTLEKAALEVNKWCGSRVSFKPTPAQDSGPLDTLKRGYGRCEEEGIFYIAVARSVGVPARMASTPYWTFKASNHAWCEVYTGETSKRSPREWGFLGACEPSGKLNEAWFKGDVKRACVVLSRAIGTPTADEVLSTRGGYSVINSTRYYTRTCRMTLKVSDEDGQPAARADLALYIFNEVGNEPYLRSAFEAQAGEDGTLSFDLGPGDYVIQARKSGTTGWAVASSKPGKDATCEIVLGQPEARGPTTIEPTGTSGVRIRLGAGGKKTRVAICRFDALPWKAEQFVEVDSKGATVDLSPGTWLLQTGRRKGDSEVHVVLHAVVVSEGEVGEIRLPGAKPPRKRSRDDGSPRLTVLHYPRK